MQKLSKKELVKLMASKSTTLTIDDCTSAIDILADIIRKTLKDGSSVNVSPIGIFKPSLRKATVTNHPQKKGETIDVPAMTLATFSPSASLKAFVK